MEFINSIKSNCRKVLFFLTIFSLVNAYANEEDLFGYEEPTPRKSESFKKIGVSFSGTIDARVIRTGHQLGWEERGRAITGAGAEKLGKSAVKFALPRAALAMDWTYDNEVVGFAQINLDDHANNGTQDYTVGLFEAYLKLKPFKNSGLFKDTSYRIGMFVPPVSLEHEGTAWSTQYSVTPSAINTWIGEEVKVLGIEESWEFAISQWHRLQTTWSVFTGNDPIGGILAWRGWAFHDYQLKAGDRLFFQQVDPAISPTNWGFPVKEVDGNPAVYGKIRYLWGDDLLFDIFHYRNFASEEDFDGADYAWRANFSNLGLKWNFSQSWTLLSQYMWGESAMGDRLTNIFVDVDFEAWYLMLNFSRQDHALSLRYDQFRVDDVDGVSDNNNQEGWAALFSYRYNYSEAQQFTIEYLRAISHRIGRENYPFEDPYDDTFTVNYRFIF